MNLTTYTKHYYVGSERIASSLGRANDLGLFCKDFQIYGVDDYLNEMDSKTTQAGEVLNADYQYFEKLLNLSSPILYNNSVMGCSLDLDPENELNTYWFHPDHLGSSSYISNKDGAISQHLEYFPFGETLVEEHKNSNNSPYKFNAKELDDETGNYYYGARYLNPKFSIWLSVDPLAEKYPSFSPYAYTFHNPINFIDPDGRDGIRIIDKKNKTITIKAVYYVQTEARPTRGGGKLKGYSSRKIAKMEKRTNKWLNKQDLSVNEGEYKGYSIQFDMSIKEGGTNIEAVNKAANEKYEGHDIGNSIEKGNAKTHSFLSEETINEDGSTSQMGGFTENNKNILMKSGHDTKSNRRHEIGHTLGLDDNVKTGAKGGLMEYPPQKISQQEANQLGNSDFLPAVQKPQE